MPTITSATMINTAPKVIERTTPMSPQEWALRVDLAACYRLAAIHQWDDATATHISAKVPGEEAFLLNPYGFFFEEITASCLVKIDLDGNVLSPTPYGINNAGFVVHSAIHAVRQDAGCVIHLHTNDGVAVSCLADGLLPLNQTSMLVSEHVAYHDYEGVAVDLEERQRLGDDLGARNFMLLRNHGTLTVGSNIGEAFVRMYLLERACSIQLKVLATGRAIHPVTPTALKRTATIGAMITAPGTDVAWDAYKRKLDRITTDYQV
jgi:ribulose-5-phosphate 4-epimerase/fuculose-1-phosphate aldolase